MQNYLTHMPSDESDYVHVNRAKKKINLIIFKSVSYQRSITNLII